MLNRRMIAAMAGAGALAASVMLAPTALAAPEFPAQNANACEAYFGVGNFTYTNVSGVRTCAGITSSESFTTKEAGKSGRAWEVDSTTEAVFTREGSTLTTDVTVDTTCTNPGGQVKEGEDLPTHCMIPTP
jgi:hypothetical protein